MNWLPGDLRAIYDLVSMNFRFNNTILLKTNCNWKIKNVLFIQPEIVYFSVFTDLEVYIIPM